MESAINKIGGAPPPSVDELKSVSTFADLPAEGLEWLASHMGAVDLEAGEIIIYEGEPAEYLIVLLRGELRAEREDGRMYIARAGQVTGLLPFSRLTRFPSTTRAAVSTRVAGLHKQYFDEMLHHFPVLQGKLVNVMADRIRETTVADQQREKLMALGRLSAGLAHELNNPASAARRAADNIRKALASVRSAALKLDKEGLPQDARVFLARLECDWAEQTGPQTALDTLERSDREEEISTWLQQHGIEGAWDLATALVDLGCTKQTLDDVARHVPPQFLNNVLVRLTAAFTISRLAGEIEHSTGRISELVRSIKEYSYMDQMPEQKVDIHQGLENTLIMLRPRLKNGIEIVREYDRSLPQVYARGSELNQIWTNLIVNAADAMNGKGKLIIRSTRDGRCARVEVIDNGPGIPDHLKNRIFEPFFTTKPVGEGTGLGLDTVSRIARNHRGDVSFESKPGETRFIVRVPFDPPNGRAHADQ
ncbi:MAG: cyclic nucleotide-binding domain-containing protein [Acidobacteriales bacterium]|nr:cyclic nucleotide-binding domain-containing protein [Terriglobales bacterium]